MRLHAHIARPRAWLALLLLIHCLLPIRANADVDIQIVRQLIADQDYQSALATLDTIEPGVETALLRGVIQTKLGQLDEATKTFEQLTASHPELPQPWNNLAVLYASRGMIEEARSALMHAVKIQPNHANAHRNLGDLYVHLALDAYSQAVALEPANRHLANKIDAIETMLGRPAGVTADMTNSSKPPSRDATTSKPTTPTPTTGATTPASKAVPTVTGPAQIRPEPVSPKPASPKPIKPSKTELTTAAAKADSPASPTPPSAAPIRVTEAPKESPANLPGTTLNSACFRAGPVTDPGELQALRSWLVRRGAHAKASSQKIPIGEIFQVYLPPFSSLSEARAALGVMRNKKINDAVIIRAGSLTHGISLGAFRTMKAATKRIRWLEKRGLQNIQVRSQFPSRRAWSINGKTKPGSRVEINAFRERFPGLSIEPVECQ